MLIISLLLTLSAQMSREKPEIYRLSEETNVNQLISIENISC